MTNVTVATVTLHFTTATYTTILLSLMLSGFGFFAGGYYAGHSTLSSETSAGVRRIWIAIFQLIGLGGILFAIEKTLYTPSASGAFADPVQVTLLALLSMALGGAVTLVAVVGLHERFTRTTAWSVAALPIAAFVVTETMVIREALRPFGVESGPEHALFFFSIFEILTVVFMLFVVYGPRALGQRDPNALMMMTGLVLFLVAPLIYTLGAQNAGPDVIVDPAGWFIACHVAGMFFVFLASLPAKEEAVALGPRVITEPQARNAPVPLPASTPRYIERGEPVPAYPRSVSSRMTN